jgi:acyl-coenzyme A synthetase/AMP-(fatty) acid ligase
LSDGRGYRYDPSAFRQVFERHFTYLAGVQRNSHRFGGRHALHDPASGRRWTYAELWADTGRLAASLAAAGVQAGDAVVFSLFNTPEFVLVWLAAQRLGAIAAPINFRLSPGEVAYVLDDSRPRAFVYDAALAETAAAALQRAEHVPRLVAAVGDLDTTTVARLIEAGDPRAVPDLPPDVSTYAETTRLYTSGTTGMPKGVSLSGLVDVLSAHDVIMHFPLSPEDRTLNMTPWFHRGGLYSGGPNPVLYCGAESVALRQFDPATVLDWVAEHGLTFLIGAPTNLAMLTAEQTARPRDLSTLKGIVTMGAPLDREACLRYQETLTPRIFNGYGTTEAFDRATFQITPDRRAVPAPTTMSPSCASTRIVTPILTITSPRTEARSGRSSCGRSSPATPTSTSRTSRRRGFATAGCTSATWPRGTRTST